MYLHLGHSALDFPHIFQLTNVRHDTMISSWSLMSFVLCVKLCSVDVWWSWIWHSCCHDLNGKALLVCSETKMIIHSFDVGLAKSEYGPRVIWRNNMYWDSDVPKMETNVSTDTFPSFPLKSQFKLCICLDLLNHFMSCLWDFFYTHLLKLATSNHICGSLWSRVCFHQLLGLPVDFSEQRKAVFFLIFM